MSGRRKLARQAGRGTAPRPAASSSVAGGRKAPKRKSQNKSQYRAQNAFNLAAQGDDDGEEGDSDQGQVKEDDDEEIDSDDAFESGDEERFSSFKFTGSLKKNGTPKSVLDKKLQKEVGAKESKSKKVTFARREIDLNEDSDDALEAASDESESEDDDGGVSASKHDAEESASDFEEDDGQDLMDLSEMLGGPKEKATESDTEEDTAPSGPDLDEIPYKSMPDSEDSEMDSADILSESPSDEEGNEDALERFIQQLDARKRQNEDTETPKKRVKRDLTEVNEANTASEHNATTTNKLTMDDLLAGMSDKQAAVLGKGETLQAPLAKPIQDRIDRSAAYDTVKDQITQWQPAVRQLREAPVLKFPLQEPAKPVSSTNTLAAEFKPSNNLEHEIDSILKESGMRSEKQVAAFEDLAMASLSVEEVAARRAELAIMRDLMFRQEIKAKRQSKIKSKSYRRIQRKEREKLAAAQEPDGRQVEEERARERMELRHRNTGAWAQKMLGRAHHGEGSRQAITERLQRGEDLERKIRGDDEDVSEEDQADDAEEEALPNKGVFAMKFMRDADAREARDLDAEDEEEVEGLIERNAGRRRFAPAAQATPEEPQEAVSDNDPDASARLNMVERRSKPTPSSRELPDPEADDDENPWLTATPRRDKSHVSAKDDDASHKFAVKLAKAKKATKAPKHAGNMKPALDMTKVLTIADDAQPALQQDLVAQAFAGDDVVAEFAAEKEAAEQADAPQEIDETLPGWGSWTGADIKRKPKKRFIRKVEGLDVEARKDKGLAHVVINEKRMKLAKPLMTAAVPFPYATKEQYERSLQMPLGKEWATRSTFQRTTMPKVVVKQGAVIAPMQRPFA
ncbi:Utp14 protein-domain-containing protein [Protomyces lactucae-debilis]|uniref:Utp14 protein-domain-containing protein n=1 Tax=Protomyces lactucae-debilis TaxID=2754530 RepID=A0A1Y2FIH0_PROLT|nr:Utp14 protein-domain-containing protein [Protomyces lactucae-debilis]ORY83739.1 Utp14 protein-domain-containing protein [Protomyces lactucae-debilis]